MDALLCRDQLIYWPLIGLWAYATTFPSHSRCTHCVCALGQRGAGTKSCNCTGRTWECYVEVSCRCEPTHRIVWMVQKCKFNGATDIRSADTTTQTHLSMMSCTIRIVSRSNVLIFLFRFVGNLQGMRMSGENTETMHLNNLERQNIGEYSCSSKNEIGENHSTTLTLRVQCE